jgi:hypothetical protein
MSGTVDPSVVPTYGLKGLFYIRYVTNGVTVAGVYQKQDDGISTNWSQIADTSSLSITGANLGAGTPIYDSMSNPASLSYVMNFKTLVAGTNVTFDTTVPGEIKIDAAGGGGGSTGANVGAGLGVYKNNTGAVLNFKSIVSTGAVTLSNPSADEINIDVPSTSIASMGAGEEIVTGTFPTYIVKSLVSGPGISMSSTVNEITISSLGLPLAGGTMSGDIDMDGHSILNVGYLDNNAYSTTSVPFTADGSSVYLSTDGVHPNEIFVTGIGSSFPSGTPIQFSGSNLPAPLLPATTYYSSGGFQGTGFGPDSIRVFAISGDPLSVINLTSTGSGAVTITGSAVTPGTMLIGSDVDMLTSGKGLIADRLSAVGITRTFGDQGFVVGIDALNLNTPLGVTMLSWGGSSVDINNNKLTSVSNPTAAQDAATKNYVDTNFANKNLSNLASTAVNVDIKPAAAFGADCGTPTIPWSNISGYTVNGAYHKVFRADSANFFSGVLGLNTYYSAVDVALPFDAIAVSQTPLVHSVAKIVSVVNDTFAIYSVDDTAAANDTPTALISLQTGNKNNGSSTNVSATGSMRFMTGSIISGSTGTTGSVIIGSGVKAAGSSSTGGTGSVGLVSGSIGINPNTTTLINPTTASGTVVVISGDNYINTATRNNTGALQMRSGNIGASTGGPFINGGTTGAVALFSGSNFGTTPIGTAVQNQTGGLSLGSGSSTLTSFTAGSTTTGNVSVSSGAATSGNSGSMFIRTGQATSGDSGSMSFISGNALNTGSTGQVNVRSGDAQGSAGNSGGLFMKSGSSASGNSGDVSAASGDSTNGTQTGALLLFTGQCQSASGTSGHVDLKTGNVNAGTTGYLNITTGEIITGAGSTGQMAIVTGPINAPSPTWSGASGGIYLASGGTYSGQSGAADLRTGDSDSGGTGDVLIHSGNNTSGVVDSGDIQIFTGNSPSGNTGDILLSTSAIYGVTRGEVRVAASQMDMLSTPIVNLPAPTNPADAATKAYVDSVAANQKVAVIRDQRTQGTDGDTLTAATWVSRNLNTLEDPSGIILNVGSFAGTGGVNTSFILGAGTYYINSKTPASNSGQSTSRLYNTTDAITVIWGMNDDGTSPIVAGCVVEGVFTIASSKTFIIETYTASGGGTGGFNMNIAGRPEIYSCVTIEKLS